MRGRGSPRPERSGRRKSIKLKFKSQLDAAAWFDKISKRPPMTIKEMVREAKRLERER